MAWLENVLIEDKKLRGERLELTDKNSLYFLGPNLELRECTLVLKVSARRLLILGARFIDCTFEVKQELTNHLAWRSAILQGCRFKGRMSGCDFGHSPERVGDDEFGVGAIEDCDFTEARLDGCRFMGCDPSTLRLPKWPCFTVLDPIPRSQELARLPWPGNISPIVMEGNAHSPSATVAVTYHAPTLAKESGTTVEALRAVLDTCPGVIF
ncbi:pentapeptide repeat-containing protein [Archangium primigenium]|uniref:pentapeptide repeat-containing protein n=1 Tax=[Archangium] primigenium TaxID=2792470 RepID=UPI001EF844A1|nr:pentapeptide repeat-containing protein [Archangium primigenium]